MAGQPREWIDIDIAWLRDYLEQHRLAEAFDLDDELIGAQVSWILSVDEWNKLRAAWDAAQGNPRPRANGVGAATAGVATAVTAGGGQKAGGVRAEQSPSETEVAEAGSRDAPRPAEEPNALDAEVLAELEEKQRTDKLVQAALADWAAFEELFRGSADISGVGRWRALAESPVALFKRAEAVIPVQDARDKAERREREREFEENVARVQNIIAGYQTYCKKHRLAPSFEHMVDFIPAVQSGHSPEALNEAWKREIESKLRPEAAATRPAAPILGHER